MFEHYLAALLRLTEPQDLTHPALPGAAGPEESSEWDPCPCGRWGVALATLLLALLLRTTAHVGRDREEAAL